MSVIHSIIMINVNDIMRQVDDALDCKTVSRLEALKFLQHMEKELDMRIGWVREALGKELDRGNQDHWIG